MAKSFNVVDSFDEEKESFDDYYFNISKNLDDIYSCYKAVLPKYFSRRRLLVLNPDNVLNANGALDFRKLSNARLNENYDDYSNGVYGTSVSDRFVKSNKLKSNDGLVANIINFIKSEASKYHRNEYSREYENFCNFYVDAVEDLENKLCKFSPASIDRFADRMHYALHTNRDMLLTEHAEIFGMTGFKEWAYCDVANVYDNQTDKNYHVLIVDFDPNLTSRSISKEDFDRYVMDKVYSTGEALDFTNVPQEKSLAYARPYGSYIVLGEEGGYINPSSLMPIKFNSKTLISNFNNLSPRLYGEKLINIFFSEMDVIRRGALKDVNYDEVMPISETLMERLDGYHKVVNTLTNMFNFNNKNWREIKKVVAPNKVQSYIESIRPEKAVVASKNKRINTCIEKMKNDNKLSMGKAIEYSNSKKNTIEELRVRTQSPFKEYQS